MAIRTISGTTSPSGGAIEMSIEGLPLRVKLVYLADASKYIEYDVDKYGTEYYMRGDGMKYFPSEGGYVREGGYKFWVNWPNGGSTFWEVVFDDHQVPPPSSYGGINGVAREIEAFFIGVANIARASQEGYLGVDGVAKHVYHTESKQLSGYVTPSGGAIMLNYPSEVTRIYLVSTTDATKYIEYDVKKYGTDCYMRGDGMKYFASEGGFVRSTGCKFWVNWPDGTNTKYEIDLK